MWDAQQLHVCLLGRPTPFAVIAGPASGHHILPDVLASTRPRDDVIDRQITATLAAILAGVVVPLEHLASGELYSGTWFEDHPEQTDD